MRFHALMYEIECDNRASMAASLIHPVFKRGHSNWLEASHSVMISKDVAIQRLHYEVSTNLALLQSNMTYMWDKRGKEYHWIPDLYERLGLPLYEGMEEAYKKVNVQRKRRVDKAKESKAKRKRIQMYKNRTKESLQRIEWSKKHGGLTTQLGVETCRVTNPVRKSKVKKNFRVKSLKRRLTI